MRELGELERNHGEFSARKVRVYAISNDDQETAQATQKDFPNLVIVSDADQALANAIQVVHAGVGPQGRDTNAPTTFLVDGAGKVRWFFRSDRFISRLPVSDLLMAIDVNLRSAQEPRTK